MNITFWLCSGFGLGAAFLMLTNLWQRCERLPFAIGLITAALIYVGFDAAAANSSELIVDACGVGLYGAIALLGLRYSLWWLALGWTLHPIWDAIHLWRETDPSSPAWYAIVCLSFDLIVATYIGVKADKEEMMNRTKRPQQVLLAIILLNLISTWFHYTDNALFLDQYPGPEWITAVGILSVVSVMTPIGILGYWLYTKGMFGLAYLFLGLYSMTSVSSPVHYLFPAVVPMSAKMHGSIWLDGVSGVLLIGFILWSSIVAQEWHRMPITD